jgi:transposase
VRCWKKERQIGVLLIGFLAQLFVSLLRYDLRELAGTSTKFIKKSLRNLTDTVMRRKNGKKEHVYSNFDAINMAILRSCGAMT